MPVLFIGHGSPMNAIETNPYTKMLNTLGKKLPTPKAILVISAHWMTRGTFVTEMQNPKTIHDFYGFPQELFNVQYPAPGSPETARLVKDAVQEPKVIGDHNQWGLDHGTWAVLRHMYPEAGIPVLQLSLDLSQPPDYHVKIGRQLMRLRDQGVLILGSGNLVHNLRQIKWEANAKPFDWAVEFDEWIKQKISDRDFSAAFNDFHQTRAGQLSVPSLDHYLPLHYILGATDSKDELKFEYEEMQNGSISMRSFRFG
ncbi:MAG: 4,5-DOPA dioxygenase extradiol [Bdellovibrionaceae bacterium]|nr:4,5-DOPA dioxygenase extradiol [Pseudobdellovibrionaceae bacterium]